MRDIEQDLLHALFRNGQDVALHYEMLGRVWRRFFDSDKIKKAVYAQPRLAADHAIITSLQVVRILAAGPREIGRSG